MRVSDLLRGHDKNDKIKIQEIIIIMLTHNVKSNAFMVPRKISEFDLTISESYNLLGYF